MKKFRIVLTNDNSRIIIYPEGEKIFHRARFDKVIEESFLNQVVTQLSKELKVIQKGEELSLEDKVLGLVMKNEGKAEINDPSPIHINESSKQPIRSSISGGGHSFHLSQSKPVQPVKSEITKLKPGITDKGYVDEDELRNVHKKNLELLKNQAKKNLSQTEDFDQHVKGMRQICKDPFVIHYEEGYEPETIYYGLDRIIRHIPMFDKVTFERMSQVCDHYFRLLGKEMNILEECLQVNGLPWFEAQVEFEGFSFEGEGRTKKEARENMSKFLSNYLYNRYVRGSTMPKDFNELGQLLNINIHSLDDNIWHHVLITSRDDSRVLGEVKTESIDATFNAVVVYAGPDSE